jgi:hypothetical protein
MTTLWSALPTRSSGALRDRGYIVVVIRYDDIQDSIERLAAQLGA